MKVQAASPRDTLQRLLDKLEDELLDFWEDDGLLVMALPEEALFNLMADYLTHRAYYRQRIRRAS